MTDAAGHSAPTRRLCRLEDIGEGQSMGFDPFGRGRDTMFVVRRGSAVYGYRNACPHQHGARMGWKKNEFLNGDRSRIMCGAHGALFRIEDGICLFGPCIGETLTPVPLQLRGGDVWLTDSPARELR